MNIEGGCHCGAITFTAEVNPEQVLLCNCTDCQQMSGAPMRAVVVAPVDTFTINGKPKHYVKTAESGSKRNQAFCPECGTHLYASSDNAPAVMIRVGCVKQRAQLAPKKQLWVRSALPWLHDLQNIPGAEKQ
jgi:hypothetical protein